MRRRRTTPNEKGYTVRWPTSREEKTTNSRRPLSVLLNLSPGVWTNHSLLPHCFPNGCESTKKILNPSDTPLGGGHRKERCRCKSCTSDVQALMSISVFWWFVSALCRQDSGAKSSVVSAMR